MSKPFKHRSLTVAGNPKVRIPQREVYDALAGLVTDVSEREVGIILPVGCGKSGCIALAPFALQSNRVLVVAPSLIIANQLHRNFDPAHPEMFYKTTSTLANQPYPEPVEIRGTTTNMADLVDADVVITNIQQLQGTANRWLADLPEDFFDLILFDEGHHNVASSWETLKAKFPGARVVNFSATPLRADGQLMAGKVIYSYPVFRAIQEGYVKRLKALVLNPATLRYVHEKDGVEIDVGLDEVRKLGEDDAAFRRGVVTSSETLSTIADASIRELHRLRNHTGESRLKIIAAALNYAHCAQVVAAYQARGLRADYVHSKEDGAANKRVMEKLENHELDVIVQVRKLGEGFDHKHLSVAAVFSVFGNLSPFVQFVGRIMRVIKPDAPGDVVNQGVVVFHAGSNIARRWEDFQKYSEADRQFFDQLLPLEGLDFTHSDELVVEPNPDSSVQASQVQVQAQGGVQLQEIPLIADDPDAMAAIELLRSKGYTPEQVVRELEAVPVTKVRERQAKRQQLDTIVRTEARKALNRAGLNPDGRELDRARRGRRNLIEMIAAINRVVNHRVGRAQGERHEFSRVELELALDSMAEIVESASKDILP